MLLVGGNGRGLVEGRELVLPGRGTTYCYTVEGYPGGTAVFEIHGWMATWPANFGGVGEALADVNRFGMDMRGHGRGMHGAHVSHPGGENYLEENADDVAAAMDVLGVEKAIVVGYSMGTAVAQLLWKRHPKLVQGLVLCAGAARFPQVDRLAKPFQGVDEQLQHVPSQIRRIGAHATDLGLLRAIPVLRETGRNDPLIVIEAGLAIRNFDSRDWVGDIDVPTAVMIMERDQVVRKERQDALHAAIPGAARYLVDGGHFAAGIGPEFAPQLAAAVRDVADRSSHQINPAQRCLAVA